MTDEANRIAAQLIKSLEESARLYAGMAHEGCRAMMPSRVHQYVTRERALMQEAHRLRMQWRPDDRHDYAA